MRCLAVIPARSGSKGLPDKNILPLCGKPLIAHTISAALESGCFARVMVSTDSPRYAAVAAVHGAQVPFLRSSENAADHASSWAVVLEVLEQYSRMEEEFTHVCLLQPTSPLRTAEDIRAAFALLQKKQARAVISVCPAEHSPLLCNTLPRDGMLDTFLTPRSNAPRQALGNYYRLNGAIYLTECGFLREDTHLYRPGCYGLVMETSHSVDIDSAEDMVIAQALMQWQQGERESL